MTHKIAYNNCFGGFKLSKAAIQWLIARGKTREWCNSCEYFYNLRHDPLLIECIETLGPNAEGKWSVLAIAKIEGNTFTIVEQGGVGSVITPNDIKWETI